jgi:anti-anti-sigma factor
MAVGVRVDRSHSDADDSRRRAKGLGLALVGDAPTGCVLVTGELDLLTAPRLTTLLTELRRRGYRQVTVDTSGVAFLAAAGLNALCEATRQYRDDGGRLLVVGLPPRIRRLFTLAQVSGGLDLDPRGGPEAASWPAEGAGLARLTLRNGTHQTLP